MKAYAFLSGLLLVSGVGANAQETAPTPKAEVGFNYSYTRVNSAGPVPGFNQNGGSGTFEYNVNKTLGLVADFGGYHAGKINDFRVDNTAYTYLFGPRFNWRMSRVTPYVQMLVGGARVDASYFDSTTDSRVRGHQNGFASAMGGGVDIRVSDHISVKPFQLEYLMTQDPNPFTNVKHTENNLRYSAGVVLRLGSK